VVLTDEGATNGGAGAGSGTGSGNIPSPPDTGQGPAQVSSSGTPWLAVLGAAAVAVLAVGGVTTAVVRRRR
jgi:hypothetical protein